jgi:thioredoxin reductase
VIDAIRERVDEDVPLGLRINADEFSDGGLELEDMKEIAQALEATGKIDYVSLSQGVAATQHVEIPEMSFPLGVFSPLHAAIREVLETTPVMTVARVNDPVLAEKILADGHADLICMARGLIADPELPNKAREGRLDDICICIACNVGCRGGPHRGMPATCLQNPAVGYEKELGIGTQTPTQVRKRVMVVGGGPGGLKAAEVAAERGHQVTLYEKNTQLGGQVLIAAKAPTRDEFAGCVRYLVSHLERLGVKVNPGVEVTAELVESQSPDAVVLATGSTPSLPSVPGIDSSNVFDTWQVLNQEAELGEKVLVVDGGECSWKFCTTADFIAAQGSQVEMITALPVVGFEIDANSRPPILQRLIGKGIVFSTFTALRAIDHGTVTLANVLTGEVRTVEADSVVFAWYHKANNSLYRSLKGRVRELYAVGDCVAPRKAIDAIREGFLVGRAL